MLTDSREHTSKNTAQAYMLLLHSVPKLNLLMQGLCPSATLPEMNA